MDRAGRPAIRHGNGIAGMTLIETIVAFAIIAIIVVVAVMGINAIAGVNYKAQEANKADERMEADIAMAENYSDEEPLGFVFNLKGPDGDIALEPDTGNPLEIEIPGRILTYEWDGKTLEVFEAD